MATKPMVMLEIGTAFFLMDADAAGKCMALLAGAEMLRKEWRSQLEGGTRFVPMTDAQDYMKAYPFSPVEYAKIALDQ